MASNRPPGRTSRRPSKPPPEKKPKPPFRPTMEVQVSWLELEDANAQPAPQEAPPSSRKKPPRLPGASRTLPPMPIVPSPSTERPPPPPRTTMEVDMSWLDVVDEKKADDRGTEEKPTRASDRPSRAPSARPRAIEKLIEPRTKRGKPIPRED